MWGGGLREDQASGLGQGAVCLDCEPRSASAGHGSSCSRVGVPVVTAAAAVANGCFQSFLCVRICPLITALSQSSSVPPALGAEASLLLAGGSLGPEELGDLPMVWPSLPGTAGRQAGLPLLLESPARAPRCLC